jgi:hypothetical protein
MCGFGLDSSGCSFQPVMDSGGNFGACGKAGNSLTISPTSGSMFMAVAFFAQHKTADFYCCTVHFDSIKIKILFTNT